MAKVIGFGGKYWTAWYITERTRTYQIGNCIKNEHYTFCEYVQNLSYDLETAKQKWDNAEVDETLKGHTRTFERNHWVEVEVDTTQFSFGKYRYTPIAECDDLDYMVWMYNTITDKIDPLTEDEIATTENLYNRIVEINHDKYRFHEPNDLFFKKEWRLSTDEKWQHEAMLIDIREKLKNHEPVEFQVLTNPDEEGCVNFYGFYFYFKEVAARNYQGLDYYLPVVNGKAKRVKNKTITVTDYDYTTKKEEQQMWTEHRIDIKAFTINK